jgi:Tol biopolymer transport system component
MELVEGEPLRKKTGEALPAAAVAEIGRQIAGALAAAHARGIIHRDIKPENILVRADGYIKILDFGLARRIDAESLHSGVGIPAGTVRYMSPEQAFGKPITTATDVFSLGLVLYELATGRHPFAAGSVFETAHAIASEDPDPPASLNPKLPSALDALLQRMLAKEARLRPSAAEVAHLLGGPSLAGQAGAAVASSRKISRRRVIASASVAGIAGAGLYAWRSTRTGADNLRLLVEKGQSRDPCFSPDGARVAFSWKPAGSDRFQLAWIATAGGEPRPLTSGRSDDIGPAWSPDGQRIAFLRQGAGESAMYVKQLKDGTERRVTTMTTSTYGNRIDWLRDSRTVVMAESGFSTPLALVDVETGVRRNIPAVTGTGYTSPKCSPDGKWIAFNRYFSQTVSDIFVIPVSGGEPRRLTFDGNAKREHRWTPDSRSILFKSQSARGWRLWQVPLEGGAPKELVLGRTPIGSFDVSSERGGSLRVASADTYQVASICRMEIRAEGGAHSRPVPMIGSGDTEVIFDVNPAISPDGLRVAFVSTRTRLPELWVSDSEGKGAKQLTSFEGPELAQPGWSPDGRYLVSAASREDQRNIFTIDLGSGSLRWITEGGVEETEPQWSRDGRWITFASSRSGMQNLWRMPAGGGPVRQLTSKGAAVHRESPDGRWIYYVRHDQSGLWRIPFAGGKEELVLDRVYSPLYRAWAIGRRGDYYTYKDAAAPEWTVALYDTGSRTERPLARFDRPPARWSGTLAVSPDERWMLLPLMLSEGSRLVLLASVRLG